MAKDYPPVIYHYCTSESFLSIIEEKSLWLSAADYTNDYEETKCIDKYIDEIAHSLRDGINDNAIDNILTNYKKFKDKPFIACFSERGDMLSQWRAYTADGTGVAIGFKTDHFTFGKPFDTYGIYAQSAPYTTLRKVSYDEHKQKELVKSVILKYVEEVIANTDIKDMGVFT